MYLFSFFLSSLPDCERKLSVCEIRQLLVIGNSVSSNACEKRGIKLSRQIFLAVIHNRALLLKLVVLMSVSTVRESCSICNRVFSFLSQHTNRCHYLIQSSVLSGWYCIPVCKGCTKYEIRRMLCSIFSYGDSFKAFYIPLYLHLQ